MRATLASALLVLAAAALADAAEPPKGPWEGFGVGTWVHLKNTTKMEMAGTTMPEQVTEMKQTLSKVTETEWTLKTETKMGPTWTPASEVTLPRTPPKAEEGVEAPKVEDLGTEQVTVEAKAYTAKKVKTTVAGTTSVTWEAPDVGVLKHESQLAGGMSNTMQVTSLSKKVKVGGKELDCREVRTTTKAPGMETSSVVLESKQVPGFLVRNESTSKMGGGTTVSVMEVVAFEAK